MKLAYCPERIVEGNAIAELQELPQIIGSYDTETYEEVSKIFVSLGVKTIQTTPEEAELAKLFTNVWRYIKFGIANQFWMISNDLGVDYAKVRDAISFEYPRAKDLPLPGFTAGPCLFKDTMQLSALIQQKFLLGHAAMMVNEGTPSYLVDKLSQKYDLSNLTVGILGMAFKANVDDIRGSLAFKLRKLLMFRCKDVLTTDSHVNHETILPLDEVIFRSDILIIGAPHEEYKSIVTKKPVIDIWNLRNEGLIL
jgi:UDP-N-acetyl-D-mannosaminuronic acid dehydrogenase